MGLRRVPTAGRWIAARAYVRFTNNKKVTADYNLYIIIKGAAGSVRTSLGRATPSGGRRAQAADTCAAVPLTPVAPAQELAAPYGTLSCIFMQFHKPCGVTA